MFCVLLVDLNKEDFFFGWNMTLDTLKFFLYLSPSYLTLAEEGNQANPCYWIQHSFKQSTQTGNMGVELCSVANLLYVRHLTAPVGDSSGSVIVTWILHKQIKATDLFLDAQRLFSQMARTPLYFTGMKHYNTVCDKTCACK